jgi:3-isopropylmalate dehydratase small subunit
MRGKCWKYGPDINTDLIIPARYLNTTDPQELAKHCMEDVDQMFVSKVGQGDIIVADKNFGCGSSREHAPIAIKASGVSCVIAKSFARIFYRNAFNVGLPVIVCPQAFEDIVEGDEVEVTTKTGIITNITQGTSYSAEPIPPFMQEIINHGGLMEYVASKNS